MFGAVASRCSETAAHVESRPTLSSGRVPLAPVLRLIWIVAPNKRKQLPSFAAVTFLGGSFEALVAAHMNWDPNVHECTRCPTDPWRCRHRVSVLSTFDWIPLRLPEHSHAARQCELFEACVANFVAGSS